MKKILILFICTVLLFSLSACDNNDKKMKGFTYDELAEYLSSVEGLYQSPLAKNAYFLEEPIICGDNELNLRYYYLNYGFSAYHNRIEQAVVSLDKFLQYQVWVKKDGPDGYEYSPVLSEEPFYSIEPLLKEDNYLGDPPNNFAYTLEAYGFNSSPHWSEWVKYNIPAEVTNDETQGHNIFTRKWYNPAANEFQDVVYLRKLEDSTEIYIIYQEISMFFNGGPIIVSEEMFNQMTEGRRRVFSKTTADEFINWFMGEYVEKRPPAFSKLKDEFYYFSYQKDDTHSWLWSLSKSELSDPTLFIEDMESLGIDFSKFRSYIIKLTIPKDGTIQDIFWELIG